MSKQLAEDFLKVVTGKTGGTVSKRFTEQYFSRNNFGHIWKNVVDTTQFLPEDCTMSHRIYCLLNSIDHFETCPTCKIGTSRIVGKSLGDMSYSAFCSAPCMLVDEGRGKKISAGWKNVDKDLANEKRAVSMTEKYGSAYNSQRTDIHHIWERSKILDDSILAKIDDKEWLFNQYVTLEKPTTKIAKEVGVDCDTINSRLHKFNISIRYRTATSFPEKEIFDFVDSIVTDAEQNNRTIISPYELDISTDSANYAFELNGLYWHSLDHTANEEEINRHIEKTISTKNAGFSLMQIWESEWNNKQEIVKSIISRKLGNNRKFVTEDKIVEVRPSQQSYFLEENHIQGFAKSDVCYGIEHNGELIQLMSFKKNINGYDWEMNRSCSKLKTNVINGMQILMSHFRKHHEGNIVCYVDRRFGEGSSYTRIGFQFKESTAPDFSYTDRKIVITQEEMKERQLKVFDESLSEEANMFANNYRKLWDCGQNVYVIN